MQRFTCSKSQIKTLEHLVLILYIVGFEYELVCLAVISLVSILRSLNLELKGTIMQI